jgi:hypothetical protein
MPGSSVAGHPMGNEMDDFALALDAAMDRRCLS